MRLNGLASQLALADNAGRDAGHYGPRWHIPCDHTAGPNNGIVLNRHAFENNGPRADPDPIFNGDGLSHQANTWQRVLIGVHDDDISSDLTVATNRDAVCSHDLSVAVQVRSITDANCAPLPAFEPDSGEEAAVFNLNPASILDTWKRKATHDDDYASALKPAPKPQAKKMRQYPGGA